MTTSFTTLRERIHWRMNSLPPLLTAAALLFPAAGLQAEDTHSHAGHGHAMEAWMYEALREKVELYRGFSDEEIDLSMLMMGPDYMDQVSAEGVRGAVGVLVLAHGFGETGDRVFREQLVELGAEKPAAVAFGMSMTSSAHIQQAVDTLAAAGAETIVVVPALSSRFNSQMRQWEYMFGIHDDAGYLETPRIESKARLIYSEPLGDHPMVARMLLDHALEVSERPGETLLIIVSHGPEDHADNEITLAMLERLAAQVREAAGFMATATVSLQNDAPREIQQANARRLRELVEQANQEGHQVAIVTNLLATRSIQSQIRGHLQGLDYRFSPKGLTQHGNFAAWVRATVAEETASPAQ